MRDDQHHRTAILRNTVVDDLAGDNSLTETRGQNNERPTSVSILANAALIAASWYGCGVMREGGYSGVTSSANFFSAAPSQKSMRTPTDFELVAQLNRGITGTPLVTTTARSAR